MGNTNNATLPPNYNPSGCWPKSLLDANKAAVEAEQAAKKAKEADIPLADPVEEFAPVRRSVRVCFPDESAWGEHVEGNVYRLLNQALNPLELRLPPDVKGLPEGHPGPERNGETIRFAWGHLFVGKEITPGRILPLYIVGYDERPVPEKPAEPVAEPTAEQKLASAIHDGLRQIVPGNLEMLVSHAKGVDKGPTKPVAVVSLQVDNMSANPPGEPILDYEDFLKAHLLLGTVTAAERIKKSDKLLKLQVDFGTFQRQIVAGIGKTFAPEQVVGEQYVFVTNLAPRKIMSVESHGMILATDSPEGLRLTRTTGLAPNGARLG